MQLLSQELQTIRSEQDIKGLARGLIFQTGQKEKSKKSNMDNYVEQAWKHLYRNSSQMILHATILNSHFDYMKQYLDRGIDINSKDFCEWTPLHCAVYIGNI